jgi:hypothetical protein
MSTCTRVFDQFDALILSSSEKAAEAIRARAKVANTVDGTTRQKTKHRKVEDDEEEEHDDGADDDDN